MKKFLFLFVAIFSILFIDLSTKYFVEKNTIVNAEKFKNLSHDKKKQFDMTYFPEKDKNFYKKKITLIPKFFYIYYVRNYDIGFSVLSFLDKKITPKTKRIVLTFFQIFGVLLIFFYFIFVLKLQYPILMGFIIGGGLGNVTDRLYRGYVVDFFRWHILPDSGIRLLDPWPIFNVADSAITIALLFLILKLVLDDIKKRKLQKS